MATHLGISHTTIFVDPKEADASTVNEILLQFDQPFGDSSAIPTNLICREIRKSVKVAIGGDGGDEMFGGYRRFFYADMARQLGYLPEFFLKASTKVIQQLKLIAPGTHRKSQRFLAAAVANDGARLTALSSYISVQDLAEVLEPSALAQISPYRTSLTPDSETAVNAGGGEFIDSTIRFALPGDYLRKIDVMSGAHGLEVRVPFLGERVLACSAQMPHRLKYSPRQNKLILRKLAAKYLPKAVVEKPKGGFGIPLDSWLGKKGRDEIRQLLDSPYAGIAQLVRRDYIANLVSEFANRQPDLSKRSRYNTYQQVYCLWALELWLEKWRPVL